MERITQQILNDPRFTPIADLAASGASDEHIIDAMRASGMVGDYAYSELAAALRCGGITE